MNGKTVYSLYTIKAYTTCILYTLSARVSPVLCRIKNKVEVIINHKFSLFTLFNSKS